MKLLPSVACLILSALGSSQVVSTRWALSLHGSGSETLVARPGGGVFLMSFTESHPKITAYSNLGMVEWIKTDFTHTAKQAVGPDGSLYLADVVGAVNGVWRIRRFDVNGVLTGTKEIDLSRPTPMTWASSIKVSPGGIIATASYTSFGEGTRLVRLNLDLSVGFDRFYQPNILGPAAIDTNGDAVITEGGNPSRYGPNGNLKAQYSTGMPYAFALLPNGITLLTRYHSGWHGDGRTTTTRINPGGSSLLIGADEGRLISNHGPLVFIYGNDSVQPRARMTRRTLSGNFLWTRDFGYNGAVDAFGGDPWQNGYVTVTTAVTEGKRLHKINGSGQTIWSRTGGLSAAVSPYNHDIFQMDKASNRIRIYCFQQAPIGKADNYLFPNSTVFEANVGANDPYGVDATYALVSPPSVGTAMLETDGRLTYQSPAGFTGQTTLTYRATKAGLTPSGLVTVTLNVTD